MTTVKEEPGLLDEYCQKIIQICEQIPDGINDKVNFIYDNSIL